MKVSQMPQLGDYFDICFLSQNSMYCVFVQEKNAKFEWLIWQIIDMFNTHKPKQ